MVYNNNICFYKNKLYNIYFYLFLEENNLFYMNTQIPLFISALAF